MTVLLTGGAGYIVSHTVLALIENDCDVVVADNFSNSKPEAIKRVKRLAGCDFSFYKADIRDEVALNTIFTTHDIGCVIHFAGLKSVSESVSIPLAYYANNIDSTNSLCNAMQKHGVGKLIFSSSATVYNGSNSMPLTEESETGGCTNPYGWTKYMCEQIIRDAVTANSDWAVALLRYFNPIGAHESGEIGEDPQDIPNNLMPFITQTAVGKRERLNIFGGDYDTPDGTCIRDYIHVTDLAAGHITAIKYLASHTGVNVFNLGTGNGTSVLEMVHAFEIASGVAIPKKVVGRRAGDLPVCYAATDKAERDLGWTAKKTISDACADAWRWHSKNPHGYNE